MKATDHYRQNRAGYFDGLVITTSILLGLMFPTLLDFLQTPGFYYLLLAGILSYTLGAGLKRRPLSWRFSSKPPRDVPFLLFHIIGHWFIFLGALLLASPAIGKLLSGSGGTPKLLADNWSLWIIALLSGLITWLVYRPLRWKDRDKEVRERSMDIQEATADLFLVSGASILSFFFWEKGILTMMGRMHPAGFSDYLFVFAFISFMFVLFYLPLRYFYYLEAEPGTQTRRLLLIFVVLLLRSLLRW